MSTCIDCGCVDAYLGFMLVECPRYTCRHFSPKMVKLIQSDETALLRFQEALKEGGTFSQCVDVFNAKDVRHLHIYPKSEYYTPSGYHITFIEYIEALLKTMHLRAYIYDVTACEPCLYGIRES